MYFFQICLSPNDKTGCLNYKGVEVVRRDFTIAAGRLLNDTFVTLLSDSQLRNLGFYDKNIFSPPHRFMPGPFFKLRRSIRAMSQNLESKKN